MMRTRPPRRTQEPAPGCETGSTLVELMIAMAIFALFAAATGTQITGNYANTKTLRDHAQELAGCQETLQNLESMDWNLMLAQNGATFSVSGVSGAGSIVVGNDLNADGDTLDPDEGTGDLYRITVAMNTIALTTYRTKEGL